MSISTLYTVSNLQNDAVALSKSLNDAMNAERETDRSQAWYDSALTTAKMTAGMAELAASDPRWAGLLGSASTLEGVRQSVKKVTDTLVRTNDINAIKAGDILSVVGGISELTGNFLVKPGPLLVAGLTLKGAGLVAGVAQNIVGDQTIGQLMGVSAANNNAPVVPRSLFDHAPDGMTLLNTMISTEVGNHQVQVYWTRNANGQFTKNESISSIRGDGTLKYTNFTQYQYSSSGAPISAMTWMYDSAGALTNVSMLLPAADGKSWAGPIDGLITAIQKLFREASQVASPLILDLDGDGVETLGTAQGVHFDHDANRFGELTGWVGKDDVLLVWDRNGNGQIDSGRELFGNNALLADGQEAANGFAALGDLDANHDGKVDAQDAAFANLRVWKDANSNGSVDADELSSLSAAGVESLQTSFTSQTITDGNGNQHLQAGSFTTSTGQLRAMTDVWFAADTARTVAKDLVSVDATIAKLPDLQGFGNVNSLQQAMARDTSGALQDLVVQFASASDAVVRQSLTMQIVYAWTGASAIAPDSRGANIDARALHALESFLGEDFMQNRFGQLAASGDPRSMAGTMLNSAMQNLSQDVYGKLMTQTHFAEIFKTLTVSWDEAAQGMSLDVTATRAALLAAYQIDPAHGGRLMDEFGNSLRAMGAAGEGIATSLRKTGTLTASGFDLQVAVLGYRPFHVDTAINDVNTIGNGSNTSDENVVRVGNGNDRVLGGVGNDILLGGVGNNELITGAGNDVVIGGLGNDTIFLGDSANVVIFERGDGQDTVFETNEWSKVGQVNNDVLRLGQGITVANTQLVRGVGSGFNDLTLVFGGGDQVLLKGYFTAAVALQGTQRLSSIEFTDGTKWDHEQVISRLIYKGTAGNDHLIGLANENNRIDGSAGDDDLYAGNLDDTLIGGLGNDYLKLGAGANVVVFRKGDGQDTVDEIGQQRKTDGVNRDVLRLDSSLTPAGIRLVRGLGADSNNLTLAFGDGDQVKLLGYFASAQSSLQGTTQLSAIEFADGTHWDYAEVIRRLIYTGTAGNDTLRGLIDQANHIQGGAGNDNIFLGNGLDVLDFKEGDGQDTVFSTSSTQALGGINQDVLRLGAGIAAATTQLVRGIGNASNDLALVFGEGDQVLLKDYFDAAMRLSSVEFADGTRWGYSELVSQLTYVGTTGDDRLDGLADQSNRINGGAGNDVIAGGRLNDIFEGGQGNDVIKLGEGADTVIFNRGDGQDKISRSASSSATAQSVVHLGAGLTAADTQVLRGAAGSSEANDIVLSFGQGDRITLQSLASNPTSNIACIEFADGTQWTAAAIVSMASTLNGTANADTLQGRYDSINRLNGLAGDDMLYGGSKNDVLDGGAGNDTLDGGAGNDTYLFGTGSGHDTLSSYESTSGKLDVIQLGAGISQTDVEVRRSGYDLVLALASGTDELTVSNHFLGEATMGFQIDQVRFADGTAWNVTALQARTATPVPAGLTLKGSAGMDFLMGQSGNDDLDGGAGNDFLLGSSGNDTYRFGRGYGADIIMDFDAATGNMDKAIFGADVATDQLWFRQVGNDLQVNLIGTTDTLNISNWYMGPMAQVESFQTSDGMTLMNLQVQNLVQAMAAFAPPAAGETILAPSYQAALAPVLAASWV
ncbi:calcium-binding protein [Variovorax sp. RHLX14]|uniref:calcium-binding protein n=1 Tax=Variovorax sp. RHLX14 TaxID=1259731 RepID=UPI003F467C80